VDAAIWTSAFGALYACGGAECRSRNNIFERKDAMQPKQDEQAKKDNMTGSCGSNAPKTSGSCGTDAKKTEQTGSCGSGDKKGGSCS
jgi:hypothetical protein